MTKPSVSPLLGYNNNVRHKSRVFHIQTEDSGIKHPHIITHLFMDGGRILKSVKKSYAEHIGVDDLADVVRKMMKEQHKAMFIALKDGQFDPMFEGSGAPVSNVPPSELSRQPGLELDSKPRIVAASDPVQAAQDPGSQDVASSQAPAPTSSPELNLDLGGLKRVKRASVPPVPRTATMTNFPAVRPPPPSKAPDASEISPRSRGKYAPARPSAIFGQTKPLKGSSIFGEGVSGDRSLDDVILSYLAEEDLDEKKKSK